MTPNGKLNLSLKDVGGAVLMVSQFTLYGDCRKGRRPSYDDAAPAEQAKHLYEYFVGGSSAQGSASGHRCIPGNDERTPRECRSSYAAVRVCYNAAQIVVRQQTILDQTGERMPKGKQPVADHLLLQAALEGLELQKQRIDEQISHVRSRFGWRRGTAATAPHRQRWQWFESAAN